MAPVTRTSAANKAKGLEVPTRPVLKIKLTAGQVRTAAQLAATAKQRADIEKAAAIETQLRQDREVELQEALQITRHTVSRQVSAKIPPELAVSDAAGEHGLQSDIGAEEDEGRPEEGTPLFLSDGVENQFSPTRAERDAWEDEPEWTGFGNSETTPMSEDDTSLTESTQIVTKPTSQGKLRLKKPFLLRDLIKTQIRKDDKPNTLESKKRKLTEENNRRTVKRIASGSVVEASCDVLTIRPGFLEEDDADTVQLERNEVVGKRKKATKSIVKVTHEDTRSKAEEKRKKSNIANCYLKGFDTLFVPELIKHISEDTNPWQPTFDTTIVIAKIRRQVYPNVTEVFEGKDPLAAPAFNKVINWRAAIGRRAMAVVKAFFGDKTAFETAKDVEEHVSWLLPNNDVDEDGSGAEEEEVDATVAPIEEVVRQRKRKFIGAPFLWENGSIGMAGDKPSGYFLNPLILETFAIHFETTGINLDPILCKSRQVGALALTAAAVERAIECWGTGREEVPKSFSQVECGDNTQDYIDALEQISHGHWEQVLASTRQYTSYRKQDILKQKQKKSSTRARVPAGL